MKMTRLFRSVCALALLQALVFLQVLALPGSAFAEDDTPTPEPGKVTLSLGDYLALIEKVESLDRQRGKETTQREAPLAEVVVQRTAVVLVARASAGQPEVEEVELAAHFEALVQGHPKEPLLLPFRGLAARTEISGGSAGAAISGARAGQGLLLVAPVPGRYTIEVHGRAALEEREGVRRLSLAPVVAAVAEITIELPADLAWRSPGAVVVEEKVTGDRGGRGERGDRRMVRLAVHRGQSPVVEIQRRVDGTEAGKLLAQSVVLTLFQLRPDGFRRHDVVLYEVSRGGLGSLSVDLPADLAVEQVVTDESDEGDVVPVVEARHLTVHRQRQLQGIGYLVLSSTPGPGTSLAASAVVPAIEARARYLAVASSVAADLRPMPATSWSRVDLSDLPPALGEALQTLDLTAAWRLVAASPGASPGAPPTALAVSLLPPSARLPTLVRERETTTLLTVDGTVVHRDRFTLDQAGAALDLTLPAGAVLWSAKVGEQPVRPVVRKAGSGGISVISVISVPLGFATASAPPVVEVVSVLERTVPKGRSELALTLPQVAAPVVAHQWRLLLPEGARYRFKSGNLHPARERPLGPAPAGGSERPELATATFSAHGRGGGAGLRGKVVDDRGEAIPGVTILVTGEALTSPVVAVTRPDGTFLVSEIPPGAYSVKAEIEGFSTLDMFVRIPPGKFADLALTLANTIEETISVTAESPLLDERQVLKDEDRRSKAEESTTAGAGREDFKREADKLKNGLVGGVKPLPVTIPETGKVLLLSGALPPPQVSVELEIKGKE
jgi:hypothetical protein